MPFFKHSWLVLFCFVTDVEFCFQIQDITIEGETKEKRSAKDALLLWVQSKTVGYVFCGDFSVVLHTMCMDCPRNFAVLPLY